MGRINLIRGIAAAAVSVGALAAAGQVRAEFTADIVVEAAKKYAGTEIIVSWEAGLQSLDSLNFAGPIYEELTGLKVKVIEVPGGELFTQTLQNIAQERAPMMRSSVSRLGCRILCVAEHLKISVPMWINMAAVNTSRPLRPYTATIR